MRSTPHILTLLFHYWFRGAGGCSFIVANHNLSSVYSSRKIAEANAYSRRRGPDATKMTVVEDWTFLHNLLSMTGAFTMQPFVQAPPARGQGKVATSGHVSVVFNGEIYNYRQLALELTGNEEAFASDGFALLPAYERWGMEMVRHLEGEFAIVLVDFRLRRVLLSADAFGTKPLHYAAWRVNSKLRFVAASYESVLRGLGAPSVTQRMALQNEALVLDLDQPQAEPITRIQLITWDLRQHKNHTRDWQAAFARAVHLRTERLKHRVFIGLSSGYDTGAIMLALKQRRQPFLAYAIRAHESMQVVDARAAACEGIGETTVIPLNASTYLAQRGWLRRHAELFRHRLSDGTTISNDDRGAIGLSTVLTYSHRQGGLVFLTGNGADEIISDYAKKGRKVFHHSCFKGIFPSNLSITGFFPSSAADKKARYCAFYGSANKAYLMMVEMTGGAHGVEARYPFLDPKVVQEFLWLTAEVKNSEYKRPIADFLRSGNFPNAWGIKRGFTARADHPGQINASRHVSSFGSAS
jgi:asparagine synthetase B (glutamine-hydrolysing)